MPHPLVCLEGHDALAQGPGVEDALEEGWHRGPGEGPQLPAPELVGMPEGIREICLVLLWMETNG